MHARVNLVTLGDMAATTYNIAYDQAAALTRETFQDADPRTIRAQLRKLRQSRYQPAEPSGTFDGHIVTLANIAAERGIEA